MTIKKKETMLALRYAKLATTKLKIGGGAETFDSDKLSEIELEMSKIRNETGLNHLSLLSMAVGNLS